MIVQPEPVPRQLWEPLQMRMQRYSLLANAGAFVTAIGFTTASARRCSSSAR
jgi:hypothetical protein